MRQHNARLIWSCHDWLFDNNPITGSPNLRVCTDNAEWDLCARIPFRKTSYKSIHPPGLIYDKKNTIISEMNTAKQLTMLQKVKVTFRIQKNRENGQSITLKADKKHPEVCPVRAVHRILQRAKRLGQDDDQPLGVFVNHYGIKKYLTGSKIASYCIRLLRQFIPTWLGKR